VKYVLDDIKVAGGSLRFTFFTNDGDSSTSSLRGDWVLNLGKSHEQVEENGLGGLIRIDNMDVELYDRTGVFKSTVFANTSVQCRILYNVSGVDYTVFYGDVDLDTVEYPSYYDDEAGNEVHSVKFVVMSMLNRLTKYLPSDVITPLASRTTFGSIWDGYTSSLVATQAFVKLVDVFDEIQKFAYPSTLPPTNDIQQTFYYLNDDVSTLTNFEDLYLYYFPSSLSGLFFNLLSFFVAGTSDVGSIMPHANMYEMLKSMCASFLCYPVFIYDPVGDTFQLSLRQRGSGTILTPANIGMLKTSTQKRFVGYRAIHVASAYTPDEIDLIGGSPGHAYTSLFNPSNLDSARFNLEQLKLDFSSYFHPVYDNMLVSSEHYIRADATASLGGFFPIKQIKDGVTSWNFGINQFLLSKAVQYWSGAKMWERTYSGVGLGPVDSVKILDRVPINGENYSAIDIERDFVANEKSIKWVLY
jgi:hypothetical protein